MIKNKIIGYDIRILSNKFLLQRWPASTKEQFLLKSNISIPLSVDRSVWPSRFKTISDESVSSFILDDISIPLTKNSQYFICYNIWDDLNEMISRYKPISEGRDYGIAINLITSDATGDKGDEWLNSIVNSSSCSPSIPSKEWVLLGYDIANSGFSSILFHFGLKEDEKRNMYPIWSQHINDYGLIKTEAKAIEFFQNESYRFKEDSPFYVFQLLLIWGELCGIQRMRSA